MCGSSLMKSLGLDGQTALALVCIMSVLCRKNTSHLLILSVLKSVENSESALCGFLVSCKGSVSRLANAIANWEFSCVFEFPC